jgi:hypothetical protein
MTAVNLSSLPSIAALCISALEPQLLLTSLGFVHVVCACRLLRETFEPEQLTNVSIFDGSEATQTVVEVGPRTNFSTAWSTNATSICRSVGLDKVREPAPHASLYKLHKIYTGWQVSVVVGLQLDMVVAAWQGALCASC